MNFGFFRVKTKDIEYKWFWQVLIETYDYQLAKAIYENAQKPKLLTFTDYNWKETILEDSRYQLNTETINNN